MANGYLQQVAAASVLTVRNGESALGVAVQIYLQDAAF